MFDVDEVLTKLTASEKTLLLSGSDFWHTTALPHHNVPKIRCSDGPNGIRGTRFFAGVPATCLPCGTALGATWDKKLLEKAGNLLGLECLAKGAHVWLGPTINIQRSPIGGRGFESYSEDPHLSGILASNIIKGCESTGVISVVKHFVCNDQEDERRAVDTLVTERALREIYARPFQIVARDVRPGGLMTAYNKVNGCHCAQAVNLLQNMVRSDWGWDPLIMSDWFGTYSTETALNAGLDLEMPGNTRYRGSLVDFALASRLVTQSTVDRRVRKVLEFVKRASMARVAPVEGVRNLPEDRALNRKLCANSIVLLKNDDNVLPLHPKPRSTVALIGSHIKTPSASGGGSASLSTHYTISLFDAIKSILPSSVRIEYEVGAYAHKMLPVIKTGLKVLNSETSGATIRFFNERYSGGLDTRRCICDEPLQELYFQLMDYNRNPELNYNLFYASVETEFTPHIDGPWDFGLTVCGTADLYIDDKLVIKNSEEQQPGDAFFKKGTAEKIVQVVMNAKTSYKLRIEFGSANTSKLMSVGVVSFGGGGARLGACPSINTENYITKAVELASKSEHVILCTGLSGEWESEGFDRSHMDLPPNIDELITRIIKANPSTVIVNQSGTPVTMPWACSAKTIVQAWYGGDETGAGIADVLFGDVNPSAKLPLTWPVRLKDNPAYSNFGSSGGRVLYGEDIFVGYRHYDLVEKEPLFCFGHGLSYTEFTLSNLRTTQLCVSMNVSNTGPLHGACVIQVYISALGSGVRRAVKELHGFEKVELAIGETKPVHIPIDTYATSFWDEITGRWVKKMGEYEVLVGFSSRDIKWAGKFSIEKTIYWDGLTAVESERTKYC